MEGGGRGEGVDVAKREVVGGVVCVDGGSKGEGDVNKGKEDMIATERNKTNDTKRNEINRCKERKKKSEPTLKQCKNTKKANPTMLYHHMKRERERAITYE